MEHEVVIRIVKDCDDEPLTEEEMKQWILQQFVGCDYGEVSVIKVTNIAK